METAYEQNAEIVAFLLCGYNTPTSKIFVKHCWKPQGCSENKKGN